MLLFIRRFIFSILLAQWFYAEAMILVPSSQPVLDTVAQFLKPPTHDKWVETYQAFQEQKGSVVAHAQKISQSELAQELSETVEKIKTHNNLGSFR